ncbi:CD48 antigen-like [Scomber scombrus]|uniref:CD48 antigen-like n=1 Tax=Scomber scombrus TaxID=13677 RepID=A0AAV1Q0G1_SCOSC
MEAQMRLIFFFIVMISAATEEIKNLTATEGGNITLPDSVMEFGFVTFERKNVAFVTKREVEIAEDIYRLHWDKNTGLFTITGLQRSDSGIYIIESKRRNIFIISYNLTVYDPVPTPAVNTVSVSTDSCILLCSVDKAETTLLWYKDEEILNQSSSALSLPLTVHKQDFSSSYRCEAANPAEHKTLHVNITTSCWNNTDKTSYRETHSWLFLILMMVVFWSSVAVFITLNCMKRERKRDTVTAAPSALHSCVIFSKIPCDEVVGSSSKYSVRMMKEVIFQHIEGGAKLKSELENNPNYTVHLYKPDCF